MSIPPTLLATVGFSLGIMLLGAPAAVIAFVALVCAWNAAPLRNAIQNREVKLIELRAEQSFAIEASVNGWTPPQLEKGQD